MPKNTSAAPRVGFYARVSTAEQSTEQQLHALDQWAARAGLQDAVVGRYVDHAMSGRHQGRPGLRTLEQAVQRREVNTVVITALDRLGRSMQHLCALLAGWNALGVQLMSLREAVDTGTPGGRALMQMAGVFAEFESALIAERTRAGLDRARRQGKRLGKPPLPHHKAVQVERLVLQGESVATICERAHVGARTVTRVRRRMRDTGVLTA